MVAGRQTCPKRRPNDKQVSHRARQARWTYGALYA